MNNRPFIRRPAVGIAAAAAAGMLAASTGLFSLPALFLSALLSVVLAVILLHTRAASQAVLLAVASAAACRFTVGLPSLPADALENHAEVLLGRTVALEGRIAEIPRRRGAGRWTFPLRCARLQLAGEWHTVSGGLEIVMRRGGEPPGIGDRVRLKGRLSERDFPGRYALELHVRDVELLQRGRTLWAYGERWRTAAAPRLEQGMEGLPVQAAVLQALVLGRRDGVPKETVEVFRRTGTMHIFAISGLHVGIVGLLLMMLLRVLGVPRGRMGLFLIPVLAVYVVSTGMKPSALRALLMAVVFLAAPLFRRRPDIPSSVAFAALVLLLFRPLEILSPGFIFSFCVVIFLVMVFAAVPKERIQGPWLRRYSASLVITSAAAGAAAVPLSALFFGNFAPIALVGNLVVVPLTFCIVLCGWLSILIPFTAGIFNAAAVVFIDLLLGSAHLLDAVPGSSFRVEPPPLLAVLFWYGGLIAFFTHSRGRAARLRAVGFALLGVVLALLG